MSIKWYESGVGTPGHVDHGESLYPVQVYFQLNEPPNLRRLATDRDFWNQVCPTDEATHYYPGDSSWSSDWFKLVGVKWYRWDGNEWNLVLGARNTSRMISRPIRVCKVVCTTDRDKVVFAVSEALGVDCPLPEVLNKLYDIGALKMPTKGN